MGFYLKTLLLIRKEPLPFLKSYVRVFEKGRSLPSFFKMKKTLFRFLPEPRFFKRTQPFEKNSVPVFTRAPFFKKGRGPLKRFYFASFFNKKKHISFLSGPKKLKRPELRPKKKGLQYWRGLSSAFIFFTEEGLLNFKRPELCSSFYRIRALKIEEVFFFFFFFLKSSALLFNRIKIRVTFFLKKKVIKRHTS